MYGILFFNNNKYELGFYFPIKLKNPESGGIGLLLQSKSVATPDPAKTFLKQIKYLKIINDYYWSIFYDTRNISNEDKGFILLGSLPDELEIDLGYYNKNIFNKINLRNVKAEIIDGIVSNTIIMDEIFFFEGNNKNKIIKNIPTNYSYIKTI